MRVSVVGLEDVIVVVDGDEVLVTRAPVRNWSASFRGRRSNEAQKRLTSKRSGASAIFPRHSIITATNRIGEIWFDPPR